MSMIEQNLNEVRNTLKSGVCLVAVSKYHTSEAIMQAYKCGQRIFGESREQELRLKQEALPKDIEWHFIGHLQTNKVKYIAPYIAMIETVDSLKLLKEINRQAEKNNRVIDVLLELHIAKEESKSGMTITECMEMLEEGSWHNMQNVRLRGIMMMASNTDDTERIKQDFCDAHNAYENIKARFFSNDEMFNVKSYGMSHDYMLAQEHGSTHVRVGSRIFD